MKIRQKLIILLLIIALIPTSIVSGISYVTISNEITAKTVEQLASIAVKQQQRISTFLQKRREDVNKFAGKYELQVALDKYLTAASSGSRNTDEITKILLDKKIEFSDIDTIMISDLQGVVLATTVRGDERKKLNPQDYFIKSGQHTTTFLREDPSDEIKKLYITTKIIINNKEVGILVMTYRLNEVVAAVRDYTGLGTSGETVVAILDENKDSVSLFSLRFDQNAALITNLNALNLFAPGDNVYMDVADYRKQRVIVATKHINETDWAMATKIDRNEALAPIAALANILITVFVISLIVIVVSTIYIARVFTNPIVALTKKTERIAQGDLNQIIDIGSSDEIGTLASTFNIMTAKLQELYEGLEQKVIERTQQLNQKVQELGIAKAKDDAILDSIGDGMIVTDSLGKILLINSIASELLGIEIAHAMGNQIEALPLYDETDVLIPVENRPMQVALKTGRKILQEVKSLKKDGVKSALGITATPVVQQGRIIGAIMIIRDITKEKEVDRMKTEFISLASHQLRTPLSAIKWFTEMLLGGDAGKLTPEQSDFAKNVADSTERMIELVNSLLNISRIESGRIMVNPVPTDLKQLVQGIVNDLQAKIHERNQNLIISVREDLPKINLDPRLIGQVYMNLLTNAIKYTQKGGEINVFISRKGEEIISQITDNGYGIPKAEQGKMFQKFFRATNIVKVETDGTGLGMYLLKAIIESSKGKIWFESHTKEEIPPGGTQGTTFWFTLPITGMVAKKGEVTLGS